MAIFYEAVNKNSPKLKRRLVSRWIKNIAGSFEKKIGAITYVFCDDEEILRINKLYLNHDYYTDIITFDYSEKSTIAGDLFISLDTVKSNADKYNVDFQEELLRVIIHGVLHLCGLKDKTPKEEKEMRNQEDNALAIYKQINSSGGNE
jgi:metalloprotein, YbeY/UPF0054 family